MTPEAIAHQVAADWIMGPVDMGDLEDKIAAALRAYGDARAAEMRKRCAAVNVIGKKKSADVAYQAGWFDGVEDCLDTIRALE